MRATPLFGCVWTSPRPSANENPGEIPYSIPNKPEILTPGRLSVLDLQVHNCVIGASFDGVFEGVPIKQVGLSIPFLEEQADNGSL